MATLYALDGYVDVGYVQTDIEINWATKVIFVPKFFLTLLGGNLYELDTNAFRLALKNLEDDEAGMIYPVTHNHNSTVLLGGIEYARIIEMINGYTVTFEDGQYSVSLVGSNNNIADVVNINNVSVRSNNSAGLIQTKEIQQASFNNRVTIDVTNGSSGTIYPVGTQQKPVNNLADAQFIAAARGFDSFYVLGNLTLGATDNVSNQHFYGQGATFNVKRTTITYTSGCITTNSHWHNCQIVGVQGGESNYYECLIGALTNAHCHYDSCKMVGPLQFAASIGSTHTTDLINCYTSTNEYVVDANGSQLKQVYSNFVGRIKFINVTNAGASIALNISSGEVVIDSSCTAGTIKVSGNAVLTNNSGGTIVKVDGLIQENINKVRHTVESLRPSHQGLGQFYYVDVVGGRDTNDGLSMASALKTFAAAHTLSASGRGDVILFVSPGTGTLCTENIVITKEDLHLRGPGRGMDFKPTSGVGIHIQANNCSLSSMVVRAPAGSSDDCVIVNGKFARIQDMYLVGADTGGATPIGTGNCLHFKGGDYHKVINCEIEKAGLHGIIFTDAPIGAEGSPREVRVDDCNIYYNRGDGVKMTGTSSNSTRLNVFTNNRIQHNSGYGVNFGENTQKNMVLSSNYIKDNGTYPSGVGGEEIYIDPLASDAMVDVMADTMVSEFWGALATDNNDAGTMGNKLNTASSGGVDYVALADAVRTELTPELTQIMLIENGLTPTQAAMVASMYELVGLDPMKPLIVTQNSRQAGSIMQQIATNASQTVITRI